MKKLILLILIGFTIQGCLSTTHHADEFVLRGRAPVLNDGTVLYLVDAENSQPLDSTTVVGHEFEINGKISESPFRAYIYCKNLQDARMIWLEPGVMTMVVDSTLIDAEIIGSKTDQISFDLFKQVRASESQVESMDLLQNFIRTNPKSVVSAFLLAGYSRIWGRKFSEPLFEGLSEEIKQSMYGKQISQYLRVNNQPNVGEKFANITMKDPVGLDRRLSDLEGNVVLLEFWASWCKSCCDQNPELLNIYNMNRNKGFEIFAVSLDSDASRWTEAIATDKLPWIHVSDLQGDANEAAQIYGVSSVPENFLIDQNGMVVGRDLCEGRHSVLNC